MNETLKITRFGTLVDKRSIWKTKVERKFTMLNTSKLSERTLRKWRKEALQSLNRERTAPASLTDLCLKKILQLTQELLDNRLLEK